jgi:glycosyltransferase involved in cell wall biosynthesis
LGIEVVLFASGDSQVEVPLVSVIDEALRLKKKAVADPVAYHFKMLALVASQANSFDLIHNHHDYWMLPLGKMTYTPVLTTLHGRLDLPEMRTAFMSYREMNYVSISNAQRNPLPELNWQRTIHHGINIADFEYYPDHGSYLAFLGRISPEKGPASAIQMAYRSGVPLKIAAKIEGAESQLYFDTHIKPHVDGKFIEYVGEISEREKSAFLGNALALAFPIDWPEPFGLVVIESLACGTPVLARPCGSIPELLKHGVTGFLDYSVEGLANRVKDISTISRKVCRRWVESRFSLQKMTEDYIHVYRHITTKRIKSDRHRWHIVHSLQRTADGNT